MPIRRVADESATAVDPHVTTLGSRASAARHSSGIERILALGYQAAGRPGT
jgi:hypothetical protein